MPNREQPKGKRVESMDELAAMPLHECIPLPNHPSEVMRVPGGWIYIVYRQAPVFVPEPPGGKL